MARAAWPETGQLSAAWWPALAHACHPPCPPLQLLVLIEEETRKKAQVGAGVHTPGAGCLMCRWMHGPSVELTTHMRRRRHAHLLPHRCPAPPRRCTSGATLAPWCAGGRGPWTALRW